MDHLAKILAKKSSKRLLVFLVLTVAAFCLFSTTPTHAGGWQGGGTFAPAVGGGGGGCDSYSNMYRIDCAGWSWIYYKYIGNQSANGESVKVYDIAELDWATMTEDWNSKWHVTIDKECAKVGGFWHLGGNAQGDSSNHFVINSRYESVYWVKKGTWGHRDTYNWGSVKGIRGYEKVRSGNIDHYLRNRNQSTWIYRSTRTAKYETVLNEYREFYKYYHNTTTNVSAIPDNIFAFCYSPDMAKKEVAYAGQSSIVDGSDNGDVSSKGGQFAITFRHQIRKVSSTPSNYTPGSNWFTKVSGGGSVRSGTYKGTSTSFVNVLDPNQYFKVTGTLAPGEKRNVCQQMTYNSKVVNGTITSSDTTRQCRNVSRGVATFSGDVVGRVGDTENDASSDAPVEINTPTATISFRHHITRTGGDDKAGGTAATPWYTAVSGKNQSGGNVSPMGTARPQSSGHKTSLLALNQGEDVIKYEDETFTISLAPGETMTFCQTLHYDSVVDATGGNQHASTTRCVRVHRAGRKCGDLEYGVTQGKNFGQLSVRKRNTWQSTAPSAPEAFNVNQREAKLDVWARPGDWVAFRADMCEGAELSNQYNEINRDISYTISASEDQYNGTANPTTWNNASLKGRANIGKGIFPGNTYDYAARSPQDASQNYEIKTDHLGKSFSQQLKWTDLWISNSQVDAAHHPGGATWENTATATVHTPYNYVATPSVSIGTSHVMPGTFLSRLSTVITAAPRVNPIVNGTEEYATRTKRSKYQVIKFTVNREVSLEQFSTNVSGAYIHDPTGNARLTTEWCISQIPAAAGVSGCNQAIEPSNLGTADARLEANGSTTITRLTPFVSDSEPIGNKICFVAAVWPADSHDSQGAELTDASDQSVAMTESGNYWRISEPSCVVVAKKPNFQVRASGAFAEQNITTSISKRGIPSKLFGSWADYDLMAGGSINGMGSGASLWGAKSEPMKRACYSSAMSFTNAQCNTNKVGEMPLHPYLASSPKSTFDRIMTRYTSTDNSSALTGGSNEASAVELKLEGACQYDADSGAYTAQGVSGTPSFRCLENGTYYTRVLGTAKTANGTRTVVDASGHQTTTYVDLWTWTDGHHPSNTYVIYVDGTLYIKQNFRYGSLTDRENTQYQTINEVPQTIFIADDIKVAANVQHLDAWLIAKNSIDTCYPENGAGVSVANCNSQLTVTGPVITKKLFLNRTFGGQGGTRNNSQPGEIFKLSPMVYLWSYSQSQRFSQAITTFQREIPTRY